MRTNDRERDVMLMDRAKRYGGVYAKRGILRDLVSYVNKSGAPIPIANSRGKTAMLISEDDWSAIRETLYIHSIPGLAESIRAAEAEPVDECERFDPNEEW